MAKKPKLPPGVRERNGKYHYRYSILDPTTGKRKQKETKGFNSAKEAKDAGVAIQSELLNGTYLEEKEIMFVDWCTRWLELYESTGKVKNKTIDVRRDSLRIPKERFFGMKLRDITTLQYQEMLNSMKIRGKEKRGEEPSGFSRRTIEITHISCGMLFRKAVQDKLIKFSPADAAEVPAFPQTVAQLEAQEEIPKYLEKEELAHLLKTAKASGDPQGYHALFIMAYTGLRIGELCSLKVTDIDEINKRISITKTLYATKGNKAYVLNTPKTKASIRKIDVSDTVLGIFKKQEVWRNLYKMSKRKTYYTKEAFVFVNDAKLPGYPAPIRRFEKFMSEMLLEAGLSDALTPHSLRHTFTSLSAEAGVDLAVIQSQLGHGDDHITRAIYLHVTKARKKADVDKLDALMRDLL